MGSRYQQSLCPVSHPWKWTLMTLKEWHVWDISRERGLEFYANCSSLSRPKDRAQSWVCCPGWWLVPRTLLQRFWSLLDSVHRLPPRSSPQWLNLCVWSLLTLQCSNMACVFPQYVDQLLVIMIKHWGNSLNGEGMYFGSQSQKFQSAVHWCHCFGPEVRAYVADKLAYLMEAIKQEQKQ